MLAGFSMLADMLTKQTAVPKVADNGPNPILWNVNRARVPQSKQKCEKC